MKNVLRFRKVTVITGEVRIRADGLLLFKHAGRTTTGLSGLHISPDVYKEFHNCLSDAKQEAGLSVQLMDMGSRGLMYFRTHAVDPTLLVNAEAIHEVSSGPWKVTHDMSFCYVIHAGTYKVRTVARAKNGGIERAREKARQLNEKFWASLPQG